jgi:DNA replication and repair protein RecF
VYVRRLRLDDFRCFRSVDLALPNGRVVVRGDNAEGKSSLLEAVFVLATTRPAHATAERELVNWGALSEPLPHARVWAEVERDGTVDTLEVTTLLEPDQGGTQRIAKKVRVNGAARRAIDAIGLLSAVLFTPRDLDLVDGGPQNRRRFLDILLCQTDPAYCRALSRYNQVMARRNQLLRRLRDRGGDRDELAVWDEPLAAAGSVVLRGRSAALAELGGPADAIHRDLTGGSASLAVDYIPGAGPAAAAATDHADTATALLEMLRDRRPVDLARGATTLGPHRDEVRMTVDDVDARTYGSRGQQRTVALSLKLAEARYMEDHLRTPPVLLLDDVLSELDDHRRGYVLGGIEGDRQTLLATAEAGALTSSFLEQSTVLDVRDGTVVPRTQPLEPEAAWAE